MNLLLLTIVLAASLCSSHVVSSEDNVGICHADGELDFDCGEGELRDRCISSYWHCDNVHDCSSGKDEVACKYLHKCPVGTFPCRNGDCVLATKRCDGRDDCGDGHDELGCTKKSKSTKAKAIEDESSEEPETHNQPQQHQLLLTDHQEVEGHSALSFLLVLGALLALVLLFLLYIKRSHSETASRIDQTLKDFNRSARSSVRSAYSSSRTKIASLRQYAPTVPIPMSTPVGPSISSPYGATGSFDNPMNTVQQPQPLIVQSGSPSTQPFLV